MTEKKNNENNIYCFRIICQDFWFGAEVNRWCTTSARPAFGGISPERKQRHRQCASGILFVRLVCSVFKKINK